MTWCRACQIQCIILRQSSVRIPQNNSHSDRFAPIACWPDALGLRALKLHCAQSLKTLVGCVSGRQISLASFSTKQFFLCVNKYPGRRQTELSFAFYERGFPLIGRSSSNCNNTTFHPLHCYLEHVYSPVIRQSCQIS